MQIFGVQLKVTTHIFYDLRKNVKYQSLCTNKSEMKIFLHFLFTKFTVF